MCSMLQLSKKNMEAKKVILSIDAESDGLWGNPFAIGAIAYDSDGNKISLFSARCSAKIENEWVRENVVPHLENIPLVGDYETLLRAFAKYYNSMIKTHDTTVLWYGGHVVEAFLFRELRARNLIEYFDAPYTPIEVATILHLKNEDTSCVEAYLKKYAVPLPEGHIDTPVYDAEIAYLAYQHLIREPKAELYIPFPLRSF